MEHVKANEFLKAIRTGIKDVRSSGVNLNKIWRILESLRDSVDASETGSDSSDSSDSDIVPTFPDPLPPPINAISARSTRSVTNNSINIVNSAQMVPVVMGLIDAVLESVFIRYEIDEGFKAIKEIKREARDCAKNEDERWETERKSLGEAQDRDVSTNAEVVVNSPMLTVFTSSRQNASCIRRRSKI